MEKNILRQKKRGEIDASTGLRVLTAVQSDPCMEAGREDGMCGAARPASCQGRRTLAAVLQALARWGHPAWQQVITRHMDAHKRARVSFTHACEHYRSS